MINWLRSRAGKSDDVFRSDEITRNSRIFLLGGTVASIACGYIFASPGLRFSLILGTAVALAMLAANVRLAFRGFRFADPIEIDRFWSTKRVPIASIDRFAAQPRSGRKHIFDVMVVLDGGVVVAIPSLTVTGAIRGGFDDAAAERTSNDLAAEMNSKLAEWQRSNPGTLNS